MKKISGALLGILLLCQAFGVGFAAERGTPEYENLKQYKREQRELRDSPQIPKEKGFWQREAERSGFAGTGAMFGNAIASAIPVEKPSSKK